MFTAFSEEDAREMALEEGVVVGKAGKRSERFSMGTKLREPQHMLMGYF